MALAVVLLSAGRTHFLDSILAHAELKYLIPIACVIPFMSLARLNSAILMGLNKYIAFNLLNILLYLLLAVNFVIFVIFLHMEVLGALLSFFISYAILSAVYLFTIYGSGRMREAEPDNDVIKTPALFNYGLRMFLMPILLLILYRVDSFFLSYYCDVNAVGFYSVALSLVELLLFIPESTGTILFPKLSYSGSDEREKKFAFILKISALLTMVCTIILLLSVKYILPLVYGNVYLESVKISYLLIPGILAMSTYYLFSSYFLAAGMPGIVTMILAAVLVIKTALCALLVSRMNIYGAAIASTVSYITCFAAFLVIFRMRSKFKISDMFVLSGSDMNFIRNSLNNMFDFEK